MLDCFSIIFLYDVICVIFKDSKVLEMIQSMNIMNIEDIKDIKQHHLVQIIDYRK